MTRELRQDAAGFRLRGLDTTRIETFTDAAFAFALTLLVVTLEPPTSFDALRDALLGVPAFLLSAIMLMTFWWAHHVWSRRYGLDDAATLLLSCLLVFTVLIYVYPLRFMFGLMISWLGGMAGAEFGARVTVDGPADVQRLFTVYGIGFTAMAASIALLNAHAWRRRDALELDALERHETRAAIGAWLILCAAGMLSITLSLITPAHWAGLPGWAYAPLGIVMPIYGRWADRRRPARPQADTAVGASAAPSAAGVQA